MELESVSGSLSLVVKSSFQSVVTSLWWNKWKGNFFLDKLECSIDFIFAPTSHPTSDSGTVTEDVVELIVTRWQAGGVDIWVVQVNISVSVQKRNVIAQSSLVELRMFQDSDDSVLFMVELFRTIKTTGIPFSNTYFQ